jgi:hypothetical protein
MHLVVSKSTVGFRLASAGDAQVATWCPRKRAIGWNDVYINILE